MLDGKINLPFSAVSVIRRLNSCGFRAYIVGGCIRDILMGREVHDIDITTDALPAQVKTVFSSFHVIETGIAHGTVTVMFDGEPVEITTHRTEGKYTDHRHPDGVSYTDDLILDLKRRDFTVNAIAYSLDCGIVDPFRGCADIEKKLIRAVGVADSRFEEDALRIMRGVRFSAQLGFEVERQTASSMLRMRDGLKFVSAERIAAEFRKTVISPNVRDALVSFYPIITAFIPELEAIGKERFEVNADIASRIPGEKQAARFAALFHDISGDDDASLNSAKQTAEILRRLKYENSLINKTAILVKQYKYPFVNNPSAVKLAMMRLTPETALELLLLRRADLSAHKFSDAAASYITDIIREIGRVLDHGECYNASMLAVNGLDIAALGYRGAQIGGALIRLTELVIEGKLKNNREELLEHLKEKRDSIE